MVCLSEGILYLSKAPALPRLRVQSNPTETWATTTRPVLVCAPVFLEELIGLPWPKHFDCDEY